MLLLLAGFLVSIASGFFLVSALWPKKGSPSRDLPLQLSLSAGLGLGLSGCVAFAVTALVGPSRAAIMGADLVVFAALGTLWTWSTLRGRRESPPTVVAPEPATASWVRRLAIGFVVLLALSAWAFGTGVIAMPDGAWDAWTLWDLRAKFLVQNDPGDWRRAFEPVKGMIGFRPEYPPLFPMMIARLWLWQGEVSRDASLLLAATFTFATVALLVTALRRVSTPGKGYLAGIVLLGMPIFINKGTWQYADVPLAFFFLAALALMTLHETVGARSFGPPALAGFACTLAALAKNEGIVFLAAAAATWGIATWWAGRKRAGRTADPFSFRKLASFAAGLAPGVVLLVYFLTRVVPDVPYLSSAQTSAPWAVDFSRAGLVARFFFGMIFAVEHWGPFPFVLPFYLLLAGVRVEARDRRSVVVCLVVTGLMLAGYFGAFLVTRDDVSWLLQTAGARLLVQIAPVALFTFFMITAAPEKVGLEPGKAGK